MTDRRFLNDSSRRRVTTSDRPRRWRRGRDEHGYVMALTALLLIPLLAVAGMAIDLGGWYNRASRMQRAADAAALAGVVWLPNTSQAVAIAKGIARENGFDDADPTISVTVTQMGETELRVSIVDTAVEVYVERFFADTITLSRTSTARYVLPVPLGSPKNYFGTGPNISGSDRENFYAAINGVCQSKVQGGPFEVPWNSSNTDTCSRTSGRTENPEYKDTGDQYEYYIDVPPNRTQSIVLHIWNPAKDGDDPSGGGDTVTTTYQLRAPDATPLDDSDNPLASCANTEDNPRTYTPGFSDPDLNKKILGVKGWSRFCTIPTSAPAGKYIFGLKNTAGEANSAASQAYSLIASYQGKGKVCDGRTDSTCPRVYGKSWISIYVNADSESASFYLAEILPEHAGKTVKITLFDPGEGGDNIRIKQPDNSYATFTYQDMGPDGVTPGTVSSATSTLDVTGSRYNGRYVELSIKLPNNYASKYSQWWWRIEYNYGSKPTDRTTWGVRVVGDPVHLTE